MSRGASTRHGSEQESDCVHNPCPPSTLHHLDSPLVQLRPLDALRPTAPGDGMSRDWLAVYTGILGKPKYRRLSVPARAALFHIWMLAGSQSPEATWRSESELAELLELDGYSSDVLEELFDREWLDVDDDKRVLVHDWDHHQLAATHAARVAYERDRKRDWRRRSKDHEAPSPLPPAPPTSTGSAQLQRTEHHSTGVPESPGQVRDTIRPQPLRATSEEWCDACKSASVHYPGCPSYSRATA